MATQYEILGNILLVSFRGRLNSANAAQIEAEILLHINQGVNQLLLDLSELEYISSAGLRVVLVAAKRLKQSAGLMVLCGIRGSIHEIFEVSGFLSILSVTQTRSEALERFNQTA